MNITLLYSYRQQTILINIKQVMLDKNFAINRSEQFYFQIVPLQIRITSPSIVNQTVKSSIFKLILYKGIQKTSETNNIPGNIVQSAVPIENTTLNFSLQNFNIEKHLQFTIKLLKDQQQIGNAYFDIAQYIKNFKNNQDCTQVQLSFLQHSGVQNYKIWLQIFVNRSRFNLQKTILSKRTESIANSRQISVKSNNRADMMVEDASKKRQKQSPIIRKSNILLRSQTSSQSSGKRSYASYSKQEQKFMTNKKYMRKPDNERRLIIKTSRTNSQKSDQQDKDIQSLSGSRKSRILTKQLSPKNSGRPSPQKVKIASELSQTVYFNQDSSRKFALSNSIQIQQNGHNAPPLSPKYQYVKKQVGTLQQRHYQSNNENKNKSKQNAQKRISFVQRTNSIVINSEQQMEQHKLKLTQSIRLNNATANSKLAQVRSQKSININTSIGQKRNSAVHTIKQSRNSKLQKQHAKQSQNKVNNSNQKTNSEIKNRIIMAIFCVISLFFMYYAMMPNKKYNSRRRKGGKL